MDTVWTAHLQRLTTAVALVATIGTALVLGYVTPQTLIALTPMEPGQVGGFLLGFRTVGIAFLAANALCLLAARGWAWVYWLALVTNAAQGIGLIMVDPRLMGLRDLAVVGSYLTDGLGALLALVLAAFAVRYRRAWARTHPAATTPAM